MRYDEDDYDPDYGNPIEGPNKDRVLMFGRSNDNSGR